jgi:very-short-patch-repair endonuclease
MTTLEASLEARAARLTHDHPRAVVCRRTAAWLWGLDVLPPGSTQYDWRIELLVPPGTELDHPGCEVIEAELPPDHVVERSGIPLTTLPRTALDCARWLPRREAVAALDQFVRRGVNPDDLATMAAGLAQYRRSKRVQSALDLTDPGAESPAESWTRVTIVDAGFPRPRTQIPVMGPHGDWIYVDLGYADLRVGLEYDGERHHSGPLARAHDEHRRRWLADQMDWHVIPVTRDFLTYPTPYLEALLTSMLQRGWDPPTETIDDIATRLFRLQNPIRGS